MITLDSLSAVQLWGEACIPAAQGDGVRSSWSWALHCVQRDGADHGQTAAGHGQFCSVGSSLVCFCFSVCIVSHLSSSPGRSFCWWKYLLPVWGEGSFDEGTQWHQTLCSVPSPCSGGGGGSTGFQLECRGGICGKDLPEAQRGGTQAGHCHLKHSTCLLTGWLACLKSNHLSSGVWLPRVDFLCNFHFNSRVFFSILFYSSRN